MRINQPGHLDLPDHYRGDALANFSIKLKYKSGNSIDLTGATIIMQMRAVFSAGVVFEFSTDQDAEARIVITDPLGGVMEFPDIPSWIIPSGKYNYDIQVTFSDDRVKTYVRGTWAVNQDITRKY